jgi:hypothetical protein
MRRAGSDDEPFVYSSIALSYCLALKNLFPASLHCSASTAGLCAGELEADLCGGGAGPLSPLCSPFTPLPLACGKAPGACCGAGVDSCIGSVVSSLGLPILAVLNALSRLNSSGGRFKGCESEDLLRKANDELPRGLLGFFSLSPRSRTNDERLFFSGDDWADLEGEGVSTEG